MVSKISVPVLSGLGDSNRRALVVISVLTAALIADTMINAVADSLSRQLSSNWGIALFIVIAVLFGVGQY
ncbi:MAG: hypothetical protein M3044_21975, partial [Thermoproteota archaeon]|nr:hypothetical protein [Thermoproteota archaeon]